jgi:anti-sigma regulatory factor (Ser/Thr protein kinase)
VQILCAYDAVGLGAAVIAQAERAHPVLMRNGNVTRNLGFAGAWPSAAADRPLASPPAGIRVLTYREDPGAARRFARQMAAAAGLAEPRLTDLVIAVGELAANTLRHTRGSGSVRVWSEAAEVICEVRDSGHIRDALAGRRSPAADKGRGQGLWVVHQVCDLVEMRTSPAGTVFRLHMGL